MLFRSSGSGADLDGDPLTFTWAFGDGGTGTGAAASHTYATAGPFTARLTVEDGRTGSASATAQVTVNPIPPPPPVNQAPAMTAGAPQTITLPSSATLGGTVSDDGLPTGVALTIAWSQVSGPGTVTFSTAASVTTTASFSLPGTYVLRLSASDSLLSGSADVTITVNPAIPTNRPPTANPGGPYAGTSGIAVSFDGSQSADADGDALTYSWNFGDGGVGSGAAPTHIYATGDRFTVRLTVSDGRGGSTSATAVATVAQANRPPTAAAGGQIGRAHV